MRSAKSNCLFLTLIVNGAMFAGLCSAAIAENSQEVIEEVVIVGSRGGPRAASDSSVPVDVFTSAELKHAGKTDMLELLKGAIPSFNINDQPISDAATMIRPANLRGLPSDSTLILVNGKRRHRGSIIAFQGGGVNDGAQGPDISAIPSIALRQIEVLRDGAAAQYGSDAIAGVINFVLDESNEGGSLELFRSEYFAGDGETIQLSGKLGLPLTDQGFLTLSLQYKDADSTSRSQQVSAATTMTAAGNMMIENPAQVWGSPKVKNDLAVFVNSGFDIGEDEKVYLFGNYSKREIEGVFYWRNPHTRGNVYSLDDGATLLVADLDGVGIGVDCPSVNITSDNVLGQVDYAVIADNSTVVGANCFAFNEIAPGGYTPKFGGSVTDTSLSLGTEGIFHNGFLTGISYDVSASVGRNASDFFLNDTFNPSMGPDSPRDFNTGGYVQLEKTLNADAVKSIDLNDWNTLNLAAGYEWREETFEIVAGDPTSYEPGVLADQLFAIGSHGFAGFTDDSAGKFSRRNHAIYLDVEDRMADTLLVGFAIRYEDFTSFGDTFNYKLTVRWKITEGLSLRSSVSTGSRAPTMGQASVSNTQTSVSDGQLTQVLTLPPVNPVSQLLGATELSPEESTSFTFGSVYESGSFFASFDYYFIAVEDRIALSDNRAPTNGERVALTAAGVANVDLIGEVNFFTNDFGTETEGVDLVIAYTMELLAGSSEFKLAYNWNHTTVDKFTDITGAYKVRLLEDGLPNNRATFTFSQVWDKWSTFVRGNYYGEYWAVHVGWDRTATIADRVVTVDAEINYQINEQFSIAMGGQNVFDQESQRLDFDPALGSWGARYYETAPQGINGGLWYLKAQYSF